MYTTEFTLVLFQNRLKILRGYGEDEISEDGIGFTDFLEAATQIIVAISSSAGLGAVLVELIRSKKKNIKIKVTNEEIEIDLTNAKTADLSEIIEQINKFTNSNSCKKKDN